MNYSIIEWQHSADKDHNTMTGWTLSVDKIVQSPDWITFYTYSIPMFQAENFDDSFHRWVHTAEHLLAYKKDTGSVRNSLEEVTAWEIQWKVILDISPYRSSKNAFGFRITSMVALDITQVKQLVKISIERAISFLEGDEIEDQSDFQWIPFARSKSCGQYDFHDKQRAITDLKSVSIEDLEINNVDLKTPHTTAYVCDLRFLKPKLEGEDDMVMFSPNFSYYISELIEKELPLKLSNSVVLVGTFWCMTGMYLCVSSENGDKQDIPHIHKSIIEILEENIDAESLWEKERIQFQTLIENYKKYSN